MCRRNTFRRLIGIQGFAAVYTANPATGSRLCQALGAGIVGVVICLSRFLHRKKEEMPGDYYFLLPDCLANTSCFFFSAAVLALDVCCLDFFWFDFGDLSPIIFLFFFALTDLRHNWFRLSEIIVVPVTTIVKQRRPLGAFLLRRFLKGAALTPGKGEHRVSAFGRGGSFSMGSWGMGMGKITWAMGAC